MSSNNNNQRDDHVVNGSFGQREDNTVDIFSEQRDDNDIGYFVNQPDDNPIGNPEPHNVEHPEPHPSGGNGSKEKNHSAAKIFIIIVAAILVVAVIAGVAFCIGAMHSDKDDSGQNSIIAETTYNYENTVLPDLTESNQETDPIANEEYTVSTHTTENSNEATVHVVQVAPVTDKTDRVITTANRIHRITFDANGGTVSSRTIEVTEGKAIGSLPYASRSGYNFEGWFTAPNSGTNITSKTTAPSHDCTYYAHWTKLTYELRFDANGGSDAPSAQSGNTTYTIPSTKPTRKGYIFLGWSKSSTFTTPSYQSGDSITIFSDTTLYAVWKAETYKLTYNANGGSNPPSAQSGSTSYSISKNEPTREGHTFLGWSESRYASSPSYNWGEWITISSDTTLYAVWKVNSYTVSWKTGTGYSIAVKRTGSPYAGAASGSLSSGDTVYYGDTLSVTYDASTGYSLTSKGSSNITVSSNVDSGVIYATAEALEYTYNIVYKSSNGTSLGSSTATNKYGTTNTIYAPSKSGYETPASQSVKWDKESKTVTFIYIPKSVSATTISGDIYGGTPAMTYNVKIEHRNRTGNSVQIRMTFSQTMKKSGWSQYKYYAKLTSGGSSKQVLVVPFNTWKNHTGYDRTCTQTTDWLTVSGISPTTQSVSVNVYHWQANANDTYMGCGLNETFNVAIPTY